MPGRGVVRLRLTVENQRGDVVGECVWALMIHEKLQAN